jgi:hypothetical protein
MNVHPGEQKKFSAPVAAFSLWLATVILATWDFLVIRGMVLRTYVRILPVGGGSEAAGVINLIHIILVIILAILWIGVVIGGAEYHYKRVGRPDSWKLFSRTLAVELSILFLAVFI